MRLLISLVVCALAASAGPLEFGLNELNAAFAERKLKYRVKTELNLEAPESFRIEPYAAGGAYISGGDLRGLMYGLLEAAGQVRATGRIAKAHGVAATPLRGVRMAASEAFAEEYWRGYFQGLARHRFNRAHVDFPKLATPYDLPRALSRIAADYAVDFTLGIGNGVSVEDVAQVLAACPLIHSIAVEPGSDAAAGAIEAAQHAGRLVTVDFDGAAMVDAGVPVVRPRVTWPPSFEVAPPGAPMDHPLFFWVWGRFAYDAKTKLPKGADAAEFEAAREAALWTAAAVQAQSTGSEYIAPAAGAPGSAKLNAADLAKRLDEAAARLERAAMPDLQGLAELARSRAKELMSINSGADSTALVRPPVSYLAPSSAPANQPLTLRFHIGAPPPVLEKLLQTVRLHYRFLDPAAAETVVEAPASMDMSFTIPATELTGAWDMQYYFEVLHREGSGWFEPEPKSATPMPVVRIIAGRTGPN